MTLKNFKILTSSILFLFSFIFTAQGSEDKKTKADDMFQKERQWRIHNTFNTLRANNLKILDKFYHPKIKFIDPIGEINTIKHMKEYYKKMYQNVKDISFDINSITTEKDTIVITWTMFLEAKNLNDGNEVKLDGVSHLVFDKKTNLVIYHRDYFDMGEFIYEYVPLLGRVVKMIKSKLSHE